MKTTDGCTIWSTGATCTISAPTITPISGYTGNGFGTCTSVTYSARTSYNFLNNTTLYAIWKSSSVKTCRVEASENVSET